MSTTGHPRVSVLLPARDAAETLDEAIETILAQSLNAWELILIDDGSTDATPGIMNRHAHAEQRIRCVIRPPLGIVAALEGGRQFARAPLLARMDADDRAHPDRLAEQVRFLDANPTCSLCGTHVRYFPRSSLGEGARRYETWLNSLDTSHAVVENLWVECPLAHPSFLMRAEAVESIGGYRDCGWPEDYDLVLRMWAAGFGLGVVPKVLHHWREGEGRLSRRDPRYAPEAFRQVKLHYLSRTLLRSRSGVVVWGAGPIGKAFARSALRRGIQLRAFVDLDPRKLGQSIHGAPVLPPEEARSITDALHVGAVGQRGARAALYETLAGFGWKANRDFALVA